MLCIEGKRKKQKPRKVRRNISSTQDLYAKSKQEKRGGDSYSVLSRSYSDRFLEAGGGNGNRMTVEVLDTDSAQSSHRSDDEDNGFSHEADLKDSSRLQVSA